ncbi:MAG: Ig-like domain-containing protein, partial [Muribaculaceae bacterium]|nr:Ig-like domain-containing protein [Muribaculaceae bacterium]
MPNTVTISVGENAQLKTSILPNSSDKTIVWTSENTKVAQVDDNGSVKALMEGKTTIKATTITGLYATCEVTVVETPAASIKLNKTEATLKATETISLEATIAPETTTDKSVTWSSSDTNIATVDENGVVTAVAVGTATITATTANGLTATCEITVAETPASGIVIDKDALGITGDNLEMRVGDTKTINVTVEPATTTDKAVTFTSSAPSIASVDADGKVTALALGETTITITAKSGVSTTIKVTVVATPAASIKLNKTEVTLKATETVSLEATVEPETTTDKSVTWSSSDTNIATVDEAGVV